MTGLFWDGVADLAHRPKGNVAPLDALRTLAILLVFSGHFGGEFQATPSVLHFPLVYLGWTGVDLFFVLSGFLIGCQLWKEVLSSGRIRVGRFLLRRGLRIWPLYFAFVGLVLIEGLYGRRTSGIWADALFVSNYFHHQVGGGWSLSSEEQFYIVAPLCVVLLLFMRVRMERLWLFPAAWMILIVIGRAIDLHRGMQPEDLRLYARLHSHSDGLAVGLLLAWIFIFRSRLFRSLGFQVGAPVLMTVAGGLLYVLDRPVFRFASLALIFGAALPLSYTKWAQRLTSWHGFYVISRLSYGIYLNHFQLLPPVWQVLGAWRRSQGEIAFWIAYLLCFGLSLVVAFVTFQVIEWPFLALRSRIMSKQHKLEYSEPVRPEVSASM